MIIPSKHVNVGPTCVSHGLQGYRVGMGSKWASYLGPTLVTQLGPTWVYRYDTGPERWGCLRGEENGCFLLFCQTLLLMDAPDKLLQGFCGLRTIFLSLPKNVSRGNKKCYPEGRSSVHLGQCVSKNVRYIQQIQDHKSSQNLSQRAPTLRLCRLPPGSWAVSSRLPPFRRGGDGPPRSRHMRRPGRTVLSSSRPRRAVRAGIRALVKGARGLRRGRPPTRPVLKHGPRSLTHARVKGCPRAPTAQ